MKIDIITENDIESVRSLLSYYEIENLECILPDVGYKARKGNVDMYYIYCYVTNSRLVIFTWLLGNPKFSCEETLKNFINKLSLKYKESGFSPVLSLENKYLAKKLGLFSNKNCFFQTTNFIL